MLLKSAEKYPITNTNVPFILSPQKVLDEWSRIIDSDYKHHVHASHVEGIRDDIYSQVFCTICEDLTRKVKDTNIHHL